MTITRRALLRGSLAAAALAMLPRSVKFHTEVKALPQWSILIYATPIIFIPEKRACFVNLGTADSADLGSNISMTINRRR